MGKSVRMFVECVSLQQCVNENTNAHLWVCKYEIVQMLVYVYMYQYLSPFFLCPILFQWLRKEEMTCIIFVFQNCHLWIICNGDFKWGIIRVTHFSANLISLFFGFVLLIRSIFFFNHTFHMGSLMYRCPEAPLSLCFIPLSFEEGAIQMLLKKTKKERQLFQWMKGRKKQGLDDMLHAVLLI